MNTSPDVRRWRRLCAVVLSVLITGCAGLTAEGEGPTEQEAELAWAAARSQHRPSASAQSAHGGEMPRWGERARFAASASPRNDVKGIAGTLSSYDVQQALAERAEALADCGGGGAVLSFRIRVRSDGSVANVELPGAGDSQRSVQRCLVDVLSATRFPRPHGGEAEVAYTLAAQRARRRL